MAYGGQVRSFEVVLKMEFNSDRKRMSVIVKREDGTYRLYCKGADSVIKRRLNPRYFEEDE